MSNGVVRTNKWHDEISELPLVGGIYEAAITFFSGAWLIVRHPVSFIDRLEIASRPDLKQARKFLLAGIVAGYLINIPVFSMWDTDVSQSVFIVKSALQMLFFFLIVHAVMKVFGSAANFKSTFAVFSYSNGLWFPIQCALQLPLAMAIGPGIFNTNLGTLLNEDGIEPFHYAVQDNFVVFCQLMLFLASVAGSFLQFVWLKKVYRTSLMRTILGIFTAILIAFVLIWLVFTPFWAAVEHHLEAVVRFL